jgi:TRAP-type C4-dicarboxylate transport system permease small subunit
LLQHLKRFDAGVARGEAAIAAFVLLSMILLAAVQAVLYNLATRAELVWANDVLLHLDWVDFILQKGTLWLAFLGASLATHDDKHIAVDVLSRVLPGRARLAAKGAISLAAGVACFFLARVFYVASLRAQDRPIDYEVLGDAGAVHICDASAQGIADAALSRPELFCGVRWLFNELGVKAIETDGSVLQVETPIGALQLVVPVLFLWMSLRFGARTVGAILTFVDGDLGGAPRSGLTIDDDPPPARKEPDEEPPERETKKMARIPREPAGPGKKGKKRRRKKKGRR